jgi:hypothetical protein
VVFWILFVLKFCRNLLPGASGWIAWVQKHAKVSTLQEGLNGHTSILIIPSFVSTKFSHPKRWKHVTPKRQNKLIILHGVRTQKPIIWTRPTAKTLNVKSYFGFLTRECLYTTRSSTQSDRYQRLYWYNLSLLTTSTMCSKHVES